MNELADQFIKVLVMIGRVIARCYQPTSKLLTAAIRYSVFDKKPNNGFEKYERKRSTDKNKQQPLKFTKQQATIRTTKRPLRGGRAGNIEEPPTPKDQKHLDSEMVRQMSMLETQLQIRKTELTDLKRMLKNLKQKAGDDQLEVLLDTKAMKQAQNFLPQAQSTIKSLNLMLIQIKLKMKEAKTLEEQSALPQLLKNLNLELFKFNSKMVEFGAIIHSVYDAIHLNKNEKFQRKQTEQNEPIENRHRSNRKRPKIRLNIKQEPNEVQESLKAEFDFINENLKGQSKPLKKKFKEFKSEFHEQMKNLLKRLLPNSMYLIALALLYYLWPTKNNFTEDDFLQLLKTQKIKDVKVVSIGAISGIAKQIEFTTVDDVKGVVQTHNLQKLVHLVHEQKPSIIISPDYRYEPINWFKSKLMWVQYTNSTLLILLLLLTIVSLAKDSKNGMQGLKVSRQKFDMTKHSNVRFSNVAGMQESKLEIQQFVDFLKNPERYQELGARIPKGALLTGPPGTGKTMLAKATAGEAGVPFFFVSGSDFVQIFVGVGAARVRSLFQEAKKNSPAIIFIDEIDAIGKKRDDGLGSNDERDGTLNQLLVEMDGFGTDNKVIVMAATNRKQLLDSALTRPGRFDRLIEVNLPDLEGRKQIFLVHLKPLKLSDERTIEQYANRLATLTPGFSGADIANLCNEAAIVAARASKVYVQPHDFEIATQRIIGGVDRKMVMSKEEKQTVAVHQSGHAVVSWFLEGADPLLKLTIIPRSKGSLGFAQYLPSESRLQTKQQLLDRICFILGGRCAEWHFFKKSTTGAADDLQKAYQIAYDLVTKYGMSERLGFIGYRDSDYLKQYSSKFSKIIDEQVKLIIDRCTKITREMVQRHAQKIKALSDRLLQKETLDGREIQEVLGQRPFEPHPTYKIYLEHQKLPPSTRQT